MQDMRDLYKAYSAVHDTTIKEELDNSKDQISAMNLGQLLEGDLIEVCEEIVEGLFQYGCDLNTVHEVVGSVMESTVEGELPAHRKEKIVRISEAFDKTFEKVASRAERNCEEEFLKYRTNKPLNEKWQNKLNNEVGNEKLHAALIHEDRETIKAGLIEMISKVIEEKKDSSYLETDMKKREKNNEKARKDMEKMGSMKNPAFEEVSTLRKGWTEAYGSVYEKKMDPVGQEDGDIDNDGDKDSSDKYLAKRRKAIAKSMGKDMKEGIRDLDQEKGTKERKASLEKKRGMKLDDHPQYKKEEIESEGYMPMTPERTARVEKSKAKAYDKDMMAQSKGDTKGADKQFKRRMAMDFKTKMKKEEVEKVDEMVAPVIAGTLGAVTGKKDRKVKKAVGAGSGAAIGGMLGGPLGAAIGGLAGGAIASQYEPKGVTFSESELEAIQAKVDGWDVEEGYQRNPEKGEAEARKSETSGQKAERNVRGRLKTMDPDKAEAMKKQMRAVGLDV